MPPDPGETRRIEQWLATARVILAISALVAVRMDPTELWHSWAAYGLFAFYLANSVLVWMLLRRRQRSTSAFRLLVHAGDLVWPAVISIFSEGPRTPFFLFFVFVLAAAAYRWGLWETVGTAVGEVVLLWVESFVLLHMSLGPGRDAAVERVHRAARKCEGVRTQAAVHALGLSDCDGVLAGISGGAAEAFAGGEGGGDRDPVEGASGSRADGDHPADFQFSFVDVWGVAAGGCVAGSAQSQGFCGRVGYLRAQPFLGVSLAGSCAARCENLSRGFSRGGLLRRGRRGPLVDGGAGS